MKKFSTSTKVIIGIVAAVVIIATVWITTRNGIISADQAAKRAWGDVESAYQRRLDLIPNLVETVKGYAAHESTTLQNVTNARVGIVPVDSASIANEGEALLAAREKLGANPSIEQSQALAKQMSVYVNAVHEAYPDLKASENFKDLQVSLESTENRINTARNDYNAAVERYNNKILRFPGSLFASGFEEREMFKAEEAAAKAPTVKF